MQCLLHLSKPKEMVNTECKNLDSESHALSVHASLISSEFTSLRDLYHSITYLLGHLDFVSLSHKGLHSMYYSVMESMSIEVQSGKYRHWESEEGINPEI